MTNDKCVLCLSQRGIPFVRYLEKIYILSKPGQGVVLKECVCKNENTLQKEEDTIKKN